MHDITYYRKRLPVSKHALDDALEVHAQYQDEIAEQVAIAGRRAAEAKDDADRIENRLTLVAKNEATRLSDVAAKAAARSEEEWQRARAQQQQAQQELEEWQGLLEAWKQKGYSMSKLAQLYSDQYFALTSLSVGSDNTASMRAMLREASAPVPTRRRITR